MRSIKLYYNADLPNDDDIISSTKSGVSEKLAREESSPFPLKWILLVVVAICVILIVAVIVLLMLYRRKIPPLSTNVAAHGDQMQGTEV